MSTMCTGIEPPSGSSRAALTGLLLVIAVFLAVRLPLVLRQAGGQDEEYYAFPGLTIAQTGVPRLPHVPQRDERSCFYRADEAFFAEPPLVFYAQSVGYALLPDTYGTGRLPSLLSAVVALGLVSGLGYRLAGDGRVGWWAAAMVSLSRVFFFPACTARPDMLCTALGLGVLATLSAWQCSRCGRRLVLAGVLLGLAGLTHPFALVFALQAAAWVMMAEGSWRQRVLRVGTLAATAIVTFVAWLPLILQYPELFKRQFGNNILAPAGPGLLERLVWPWPALAHHAVLLWEYAGPIQVTLMFGGLLAATVIAVRQPAGGLRPLVGLTWSAVLLTAVLTGSHPAHGYWSYAGGLMFLCLAAATVRLAALSPRAVWVTGGLILLALLPGAGLRTWAAHLRHWNDPGYNGPAFARELIARLPADAVCAVDTEFVLDFYAAGRKTIIAETHRFYFTTAEADYDYLILSRRGLDRKMPDELPGRLVQTIGDRDDLFACYAEVYVRDREAPALSGPRSPVFGGAGQGEGASALLPSANKARSTLTLTLSRSNPRERGPNAAAGTGR